MKSAYSKCIMNRVYVQGPRHEYLHSILELVQIKIVPCFIYNRSYLSLSTDRRLWDFQQYQGKATPFASDMPSRAALMDPWYRCGLWLAGSGRHVHLLRKVTGECVLNRYKL